MPSAREELAHIRGRYSRRAMFPLAAGWVVGLLWLAGAARTWADDATSAGAAPLTANDQGGFDFETERIKGTIEPQGPYHGVTVLIDKATGRQVIDERYSALNLFKLLSAGAFHGEPRSMERTVASGPDWVEITWPASAQYRGEVTARYEVREPAAIDLTIRIRSQGTYAAHELFLSSYFDKALVPHVSLAALPGARPAEPEFVVPLVNDLFRGALPVFARDAHAARHCIDGRWERNEFGTPIVQMIPLRHYGHCLAYMADAEHSLGVVLMSRPTDCYAISSRYHADREADRLTSYSAFDMSLFGDNFLAGTDRQVAVRLAITELDRDASQPLQLYQAFLAGAN